MMSMFRGVALLGVVLVNSKFLPVSNGSGVVGFVVGSGVRSLSSGSGDSKESGESKVSIKESGKSSKSRKSGGSGNKSGGVGVSSGGSVSNSGGVGSNLGVSGRSPGGWVAGNFSKGGSFPKPVLKFKPSKSVGEVTGKFYRGRQFPVKSKTKLNPGDVMKKPLRKWLIDKLMKGYKQKGYKTVYFNGGFLAVSNPQPGDIYVGPVRQIAHEKTGLTIHEAWVQYNGLSLKKTPWLVEGPVGFSTGNLKSRGVYGVKSSKFGLSMKNTLGSNVIVPVELPGTSLEDIKKRFESGAFGMGGDVNVGVEVLSGSKSLNGSEGLKDNGGLDVNLKGNSQGGKDLGVSSYDDSDGLLKMTFGLFSEELDYVEGSAKDVEVTRILTRGPSYLTSWLNKKSISVRKNVRKMLVTHKMTNDYSQGWEGERVVFSEMPVRGTLMVTKPVDEGCVSSWEGIRRNAYFGEISETKLYNNYDRMYPTLDEVQVWEVFAVRRGGQGYAAKGGVFPRSVVERTERALQRNSRVVRQNIDFYLQRHARHNVLESGQMVEVEEAVDSFNTDVVGSKITDGSKLVEGSNLADQGVVMDLTVGKVHHLKSKAKSNSKVGKGKISKRKGDVKVKSAFRVKKEADERLKLGVGVSSSYESATLIDIQKLVYSLSRGYRDLDMGLKCKMHKSKTSGPWWNKGFISFDTRLDPRSDFENYNGFLDVDPEGRLKSVANMIDSGLTPEWQLVYPVKREGVKSSLGVKSSMGGDIPLEGKIATDVNSLVVRKGNVVGNDVVVGGIVAGTSQVGDVEVKVNVVSSPVKSSVRMEDLPILVRVSGTKVRNGVIDKKDFIGSTTVYGSQGLYGVKRSKLLEWNHLYGRAPSALFWRPSKWDLVRVYDSNGVAFNFDCNSMRFYFARSYDAHNLFYHLSLCGQEGLDMEKFEEYFRIWLEDLERVRRKKNSYLTTRINLRVKFAVESNSWRFNQPVEVRKRFKPFSLNTGEFWWRLHDRTIKDSIKVPRVLPGVFMPSMEFRGMKVSFWGLPLISFPSDETRSGGELNATLLGNENPYVWLDFKKWLVDLLLLDHSMRVLFMCQVRSIKLRKLDLVDIKEFIPYNMIYDIRTFTSIVEDFVEDNVRYDSRVESSMLWMIHLRNKELLKTLKSKLKNLKLKGLKSDSLSKDVLFSTKVELIRDSRQGNLRSSKVSKGKVGSGMISPELGVEGRSFDFNYEFFMVDTNIAGDVHTLVNHSDRLCDRIHSMKAKKWASDKRKSKHWWSSYPKPVKDPCIPKLTWGPHAKSLFVTNPLLAIQVGDTLKRDTKSKFYDDDADLTSKVKSRSQDLEVHSEGHEIVHFDTKGSKGSSGSKGSKGSKVPVESKGIVEPVYKVRNRILDVGYDAKMAWWSPVDVSSPQYKKMVRSVNYVRPGSSGSLGPVGSKVSLDGSFSVGRTSSGNISGVSSGMSKRGTIGFLIVSVVPRSKGSSVGLKGPKALASTRSALVGVDKVSVGVKLSMDLLSWTSFYVSKVHGVAQPVPLDLNTYSKVDLKDLVYTVRKGKSQMGLKSRKGLKGHSGLFGGRVMGSRRLRVVRSAYMRNLFGDFGRWGKKKTSEMVSISSLLVLMKWAKKVSLDGSHPLHKVPNVSHIVRTLVEYSMLVSQIHMSTVLWDREFYEFFTSADPFVGFRSLTVVGLEKFRGGLFVNHATLMDGRVKANIDVSSHPLLLKFIERQRGFLQLLESPAESLVGKFSSSADSDVEFFELWGKRTDLCKVDSVDGNFWLDVGGRNGSGLNNPMGQLSRQFELAHIHLRVKLLYTEERNHGNSLLFGGSSDSGGSVRSSGILGGLPLRSTPDAAYSIIFPFQPDYYGLAQMVGRMTYGLYQYRDLARGGEPVDEQDSPVGWIGDHVTFKKSAPRWVNFGGTWEDVRAGYRAPLKQFESVIDELSAPVSTDLKVSVLSHVGMMTVVMNKKSGLSVSQAAKMVRSVLSDGDPLLEIPVLGVVDAVSSFNILVEEYLDRLSEGKISKYEDDLSLGVDPESRVARQKLLADPVNPNRNRVRSRIQSEQVLGIAHPSEWEYSDAEDAEVIPKGQGILKDDVISESSVVSRESQGALVGSKVSLGSVDVDDELDHLLGSFGIHSRGGVFKESKESGWSSLNSRYDVVDLVSSLDVLSHGDVMPSSYFYSNFKFSMEVSQASDGSVVVEEIYATPTWVFLRGDRRGGVVSLSYWSANKPSRISELGFQLVSPAVKRSFVLFSKDVRHLVGRFVVSQMKSRVQMGRILEGGQVIRDVSVSNGSDVFSSGLNGSIVSDSGMVRGQKIRHYKDKVTLLLMRVMSGVHSGVQVLNSNESVGGISQWVEGTGYVNVTVNLYFPVSTSFDVEFLHHSLEGELVSPWMSSRPSMVGSPASDRLHGMWSVPGSRYNRFKRRDWGLYQWYVDTYRDLDQWVVSNWLAVAYHRDLKTRQLYGVYWLLTPFAWKLANTFWFGVGNIIRSQELLKGSGAFDEALDLPRMFMNVGTRKGFYDDRMKKKVQGIIAYDIETYYFKPVRRALRIDDLMVISSSVFRSATTHYIGGVPSQYFHLVSKWGYDWFLYYQYMVVLRSVSLVYATLMHESTVLINKIRVEKGMGTRSTGHLLLYAKSSEKWTQDLLFGKSLVVAHPDLVARQRKFMLIVLADMVGHYDLISRSQYRSVSLRMRNLRV